VTLDEIFIFIRDMNDVLQPLTNPTTLVDQDRVRWPGSGSSVVGRTPFGFYDSDTSFQVDAPSAAVWAAYRLGYPIVDIEMLDVNFYAAFEEAVNEYSAQVNQWNIRNYMQVFQGQKVTDLGNLTGRAVTGTPLPYIIELSKEYGREVGVGGYADWKKGFIVTKPMKQVYDLQELWGDKVEDCNRIEVMRVFHDFPPAFARIYDPFSMTGMSYSNVLNELGFGAYSPAVQFLMTPIFEDLLRGQAIQFNDMVRKSAFSFELTNNKLRLFPIPTYGFKVYFHYMVRNDRLKGEFANAPNYTGSYVADYANIPYNNITYNTINSVGRQWVRKYFLALCKELLGCIRQKYQTLPIPGGDVTLDGAELRNEAQQEKTDLITQLRESLDAASQKSQTENQALQAEQMQETLKRVPLFIYIG
jgi:hypothetical protein